jgi:hypothetical protein
MVGRDGETRAKCRAGRHELRADERCEMEWHRQGSGSGSWYDVSGGEDAGDVSGGHGLV